MFYVPPLANTIYIIFDLSTSHALSHDLPTSFCFSVITCSHLNAMGISTENNPNCIDKEKRLQVYTRCEFKCPEGYVFEKAQLQTIGRYCLENGKWSGEDDVCLGLFRFKKFLL